MDKMKQQTGEATITYENPDASMRAIEMFNQKDFNGKGIITVSIATPEQKQPFANKLVSIKMNIFYEFLEFHKTANFSEINSKYHYYNNVSAINIFKLFKTKNTEQN